LEARLITPLTTPVFDPFARARAHHREPGTGTARGRDGYIAADRASVIGSSLSDTEPNMTKTTTMLCAAASALALYSASAAAAPLSAPLALKSAETQSTEAVRYYRRHHGRWIGGPRAYYGFGYNSYAYVPRYGAPRHGGFRRGPHSCSREEAGDSAYPSWWCSRIRNYQ
jgi:hypothetical protein